jgi:hypothetical protein
MKSTLKQYWRCPESCLRLELSGDLGGDKGYFRFGSETLYGRCAHALPAHDPAASLPDLLNQASLEEGTVRLPFDFDEVVNNLRQESYVSEHMRGGKLADAYYFLRPLLPVAVRKHLQRARLRHWREIRFPRWPVDRTVDDLMAQAVTLLLRTGTVAQIPFIWFWPEGATGCALMTHDIETQAGVELCPALMDLDDAFGIPASFQVVPEERYLVQNAFLDSLRRRGFEVVIHDLNHDGHLFRSREHFAERVHRINAYGKEFGAAGFRAGVLYRNQSWFDLLDFDYDMSVPNVGHLDPQHGGCCTVMPYFVGKVLELPVTTTQDYSLFHILREHSTDLWERQIEMIMEKHGLISMIVHPDYLVGEREKHVYEALLAYLSRLRQSRQLWIATPGEVNRWWRQRAEMEIVERNGKLEIEGSGKERACIAYASESGGRLEFSLEPSGQTTTVLSRSVIGSQPRVISPSLGRTNR